jgi:hypothetical protein
MRWLKKWPLLVLAILAVASVIGWEERHCQAQAEQCRAAYSAQARSDRNSFWLTPDQHAAEQEAITAACEPNGYFCRLFGTANLPAVFLVFIGIGGVLAALRTLKAIQRQADVAINAERAWLVVELVPTGIKFNGVRYKPVGSTSEELVESDLSDGNNFEYTLKITNMGKTPALITKYAINVGDGMSEPRVIASGSPHLALAGERQWYFDPIDVATEVKKYANDAAISFYGEVFYEHVFAKGEAIEESFAYRLEKSTGRLSRASTDRNA